MRLVIFFFALCFTFAYNGTLLAQNTASTPTTTTSAAPRIIGEVKEINREQNWLTIKTNTGDVRINVEKNVVCKRVAPDAKTLEGAENIALTDILPGDRVWARNTTNLETANTVQAKQLVLMSATSIAERNRRDRENWQRRGIVGEITAVDTEKKEFTVKLRDGNIVALSLAPQADVRRYPPGSVEFTGSKQISADELKVGDSVFSRGERSEDGKSFKAEMLITGDVPRPTFGQITAINLETQEITVKGREREVVIKVGTDTLLRKMPEDAFNQGQGQASGNPSSVPPPPPPPGQAGPDGQRPPRAERPAPPSAPGQNSSAQAGRPEGPGQGARRGAMFGNPEAMMERLRNSPEIKLNDLKVGEYVITNGPKSEDGKSIKALFVMKVRTPAPNGQNSPGLGTGGGGFGEGGPQ